MGVKCDHPSTGSAKIQKPSVAGYNSSQNVARRWQPCCHPSNSIEAQKEEVVYNKFLTINNQCKIITAKQTKQNKHKQNVTSMLPRQRSAAVFASSSSFSFSRRCRLYAISIEMMKMPATIPNATIMNTPINARQNTVVSVPTYLTANWYTIAVSK